MYAQDPLPAVSAFWLRPSPPKKKSSLIKEARTISMYVYVLIDLSSFIDLPNQGTVVLDFLFLVVAKLSQALAKLAQLSYIITINCQHPHHQRILKQLKLFAKFCINEVNLY